MATITMSTNSASTSNNGGTGNKKLRGALTVLQNDIDMADAILQNGGTALAANDIIQAIEAGEEEVPQTKPKHEISILAEMSPKKKLEKQSCFPCMGNALKTSLVGFQPHGAEKSPLGALTLGSEWLHPGWNFRPYKLDSELLAPKKKFGTNNVIF